MNRDKAYLRIAQEIGQAGTCPRAQVGAILVIERVVVSSGYNGSPRGLEHCDCIVVHGHCVRAVHAEVNALYNAPVLPRGGTLYTTHQPCVECSKVIINNRIARLVYGISYHDNRITDWNYPDTSAMLREGGVEVDHCPS